MAALLGKKQVEGWMTGNKSRQVLYWRTPLLLQEDAPTQFVDVSVNLILPHQESPPSLKLSLGMLYQDDLQQSYYSTAILTKSILQVHFECVGIDIATTQPPVMAKAMAKALQGSNQILRRDDNGKTVLLQLHYPDLQERGDLVLPLASDCVLTHQTLFMLQVNLAPKDTTVVEVTLLLEEDVGTSLETILEQLKPVGNVRAGQEDASVVTSSTRNNREGKAARRPGFVLPPQQRKKPKTLSYASKKDGTC
jgi:hypothetical protein